MNKKDMTERKKDKNKERDRKEEIASTEFLYGGDTIDIERATSISMGEIAILIHISISGPQTMEAKMID